MKLSTGFVVLTYLIFTYSNHPRKPVVIPQAGRLRKAGD